MVSEHKVSIKGPVIHELDIPIKNRRAASPAKFLQAAKNREQPDHPIEQAHRYLALGRRWINQEEGNIPTRA